MELQEAWDLVDFYLAHIDERTKQLLRKATEKGAKQFLLAEIEIAEKEIREAAVLSKKARERILNLYSDRRKGLQDGPVQ